ncbi:unnamed protein product [Brassicogethes aeneus]|uniref:AB hydrolase-1 domain-containing protein n=1 Tax=Brassicogethes aeneus TaxID=1431903 RepID=A0A9P0FMY0_BRAAE|nr:unnamed protein product [Brassicogethes aeneus]
MVFKNFVFCKYAKHTLEHLKYIYGREVRIEVPWGFVAGKWYGPVNKRPILTLHGWMDNCGSMERLISNINKHETSFLSIDFPGHGLSSRFPNSMYYDYKDYVFTVFYLIEQFQWSKVSLMGHSLGSGVAYMYSMLFPEKVDYLICLETIKPPIRENNDRCMANAIKQFFKYDAINRSGVEPRCYTYLELKLRYIKLGIHPQLVHYILDRNLVTSKNIKGKFYFGVDSRVKCHGFWNFPQNESIKYAQNMSFPIFIGKCNDENYWENPKYYKEVLEVNQKFSKDCQFHLVDGCHFEHINNPDKYGEKIVKFLDKHDDMDRSWKNCIKFVNKDAKNKMIG